MNVRNCIIGISTGVLISSSVNAESYKFDFEKDMYLSLFGRAMQILDQDVSAGADDFGVQAGSADYEVNYETGYSVGALVGFPLVRSFRGELEGSYSWWDVSDWDGQATLTIDGTNYSLGGSSDVDQWGRSLSLYSNLIWDVKGDTGISFLKPYIGVGFGADAIKEKLKTVTIAGSVVTVDEVAKGVYYGMQTLVGADVLTTSNWTGGLRFGFRKVFHSEDDPARDVEVMSVQGNLRYNF